MMQAQKQAAIQADFERYLQDYPQLKHALKGALSTVVKIRPTDPLEFLAERLREENIQIKVAQQEEQLASIRIQARSRGISDRKRVADLKLQRQQEKAAVKIQARARGKQDRSHAQQKLVNLHVWLLNLFDHMACKHTKKVDVGLLAGYIQSDPSVLQEAERVLQHQAATKIQAVERGKSTRKKRRAPGNSGHALMPYSLAQMSTGEPAAAAAAGRGGAGQETAREGVSFQEFAGVRENADMNYAQARALFDELDVNKDDAEELSHYKP